jgi:hypothetical protein
MDLKMELSSDCIWCKIMESEIFRVQCKSCKRIIESRHSTDFKTCDCGLISIDGGGSSKNNRRLVGCKEDIELPDSYGFITNANGKRNRI